ncbi:MAG TPA: TerC family protein [Polyangiaceae bacterium]|nr:TerC family protein [Polyangiaceae bacterium]
MVWLWLGFSALVLLLLILDLGVFHRHAHEVTLREASIWTVVWISLGLAFTGVVYLIYDRHWFGAEVGGTGGSAGHAALLYVTGYVLEKSLSVDNIFVISVIFRSFRVEARFRHRVLFWGIIGAIVLRAAMILGGAWLVHRFSWVFYVFGAYLAYTGVNLFREKDSETDPERSRFIRLARRFLPVARQEHGPHLTARENGHTVVTRLGLVLIAVEGTDVIFALDSIPAILAITTDSFIVFTSNIFAILGLRSLYFILEGMMGRFRHLQVALAFVLVFIGAKMLLHDVFVLPNLLSLGVILGAVIIGVLASLLSERGEAKSAEAKSAQNSDAT